MIRHPGPPAGRGDRGELVQALGRLSRAATEDFAVDDMLRELCETAAASLRVDSVGVMGILEEDGSRRRGRFVHSDPEVFDAEQLQQALQAGPCHDAMESGHLVAIDDLRTQHGRWEPFVTSVLESQMRAVVPLPLRSRGRSWGSLDLYRRSPGPGTSRPCRRRRCWPMWPSPTW